MADSNLTISQYNPLQQLKVRQWETFSPSDQLMIVDKIDLIIQTLNRLGKLSNDVVTDWNKVMTWVMNDGMTVEVDSQLQKWKDDGTLTALINAYTNIGDLSTLQTVAKDTIVNAINENVTHLAEKALQTDLVTTNTNVSLKANQTDLNKTNSKVSDLASANVKDYGIVSDGTTDQTTALVTLFTTGQLANFVGNILIPYNTKFTIPTVFQACPVTAYIRDLSMINMSYTSGYKQKYVNYGGSDTTNNDFALQVLSGHHSALLLNNMGSSGTTSANGYYDSIIFAHGFNVDGSDKTHAMIQCNTDGAGAIGSGSGKWRFIYTFLNKFADNSTQSYTAFQVDEEGIVNMRAKKLNWNTISGATPTVTNGTDFNVNNSSATTVTNLITTLANQEVTLLFANGNTTLQNGSNFKLAGSINWTPTAYSSITLKKCSSLSGAWIEVGRTQM